MSVSDTTPTDREVRIEKIRRAAIPVFAAKGFRGTSMADIAEAAGVSRPALYQYFENRADVFRAGFDMLLNDGTDAALQAMAAADTIEGALKRASEPGTVLLEVGEGGLDKQSVVLASQVSSVRKDRLGAYIGALASTRVDEIVSALRFLQASYFRGR